MSYYVIENFKQGLDTRRFELSAPPGAITRIENAHITQAGDIEKRKAFTLHATAPADTFGLESTAAGLVVFGSKDLNTSVVAAGLKYIRCQHPDGTTDMEAVLCSGTYGGKAWCAARFTDDLVFGFYDGGIISGFKNGLVLSGLTDTDDIATAIKEAMESKLRSLGFSVTVSGSVVDLKSASGSTYDVRTSDAITDDGTLVYSTIASSDSSGTTGTAPYCTLDLSSGTTGQIVSILAPYRDVNSDIQYVELLGSPVLFTTNLETTASLLAAEINRTVSSAAKYSAHAVGQSVGIVAPLSQGEWINGLPIKITYNGDLVFDGDPPEFLVSLPIEKQVRWVNLWGSDVLIQTTVSAVVTLGTGPYTYLWEKCSDISNATSIVGATNQPSITVSAYYADANVPGAGAGMVFRSLYKLTVTDSTSASVIAYMYVTFVRKSTDGTYNFPPLP